MSLQIWISLICSASIPKEGVRGAGAHRKTPSYWQGGTPEFFPLKTRKIQSDDQPFITHKLKQMDRKRKRVFNKERKSEKYKKLKKMFKKEHKSAKASFYK